MTRIKEYLPKEELNHWGRGCDKCKYGIVMAPELTGACSLHLERMVQALSKQIIFCECQAGTRYRVFLLNYRQKLIEEARHDKRMAQSANGLTHPEIEWAKVKIGEKVQYVAQVEPSHA